MLYQLSIFQKKINVFLRLLTLTSRFLLIFFLAKYLSTTDLGIYGLFTITISYSMYIVGMDFYTYSTREIARLKNQKSGLFLKSQVLLSIYLYLIFVPLAIFFFIKNQAINQLLFWFFPLLILEHLNQEITRILTIFNEQILSSALLFIRQGIWVIILIIIMSLDNTTRNLSYLFSLWLIAGLITAMLGTVKIKNLNLAGWQDKIEWGWIKKGIKTSLILLIATLSLRGIQTIDRYWLERLAGLDIVGTYVLFFGIASTLLVFMDAAVYSYSYPQLIYYYNSKNKVLFTKLIKKMTYDTLIISFLYGVISILTLPILLKWIDNSLYSTHQNIYLWLFAAMTINVLGMIPHYGLYASNKDSTIVLSSIIALIVFIASVLLYKEDQTILAIPIALCLSFTVLTLWKWTAFLYQSKNHP